jgi:hypothetical protein
MKTGFSADLRKYEVMTDTLITTNELFSLFESTWMGEGRGEYPGVSSFAYRETLTFTRRDQDSLDYEQNTQKLYDGQTEYLPSHGETGTIRRLENGELELVNQQAKDRRERLVGIAEKLGDLIRIRFVSTAIDNDPRMISSTRTFELESDTLRYEMAMHTTKVEELTPHLKIALQREK